MKLRWAFFARQPCMVRGDKELKPLFDWMLRGLLPRLGAPDTQLSFLHVTDFAQAVGQWLSAETVQTQTYELCDGVAGGYDWQRVRQLAAEARCGSVRMVGIPLPVLTCLADISTALSRPAGKEPMLTRSKIRELTHADWSANNNRISEDINWFPGISLGTRITQRAILIVLFKGVLTFLW